MSTLHQDEMQRRQASNRKLGWALGGVALVFYIVGLFVAR